MSAFYPQSTMQPGKPELPSQPKPPVPDLKASSMNDYNNDYDQKGLPQPAPESNESS